MTRVSLEEFAIYLYCGDLSGKGKGSFLQCKKYLGISTCDKGSRLPSRLIRGNPFSVVPAIHYADDIPGVAAIFLNTDHILIPAKRNPGTED